MRDDCLTMLGAPSWYRLRARKITLTLVSFPPASNCPTASRASSWISYAYGFYIDQMGFIRVSVWQNQIFARFYFGAAGIFCGFFRRILSLLFRGIMCPEPGNPRQNPPKFMQQECPTHFCRRARPRLVHQCDGH